MTITAKMADGTTLEFPDGTDTSVIQRTVKRLIAENAATDKIDVRMPDGTIVKGVPSGTTKAELAQKLRKSGMSVPADWLAAEKPKAAMPEPSGWDQALSALKKGTGDVITGVGALPTMIADAPGHLVNAGAAALGSNFRVPSFAQGQQEVLQRYGMASDPGFGRVLRQGLAGLAGGLPVGGVMAGAGGVVGNVGRAMAAQPIQQAIGTGVGGLTGEALRQIGAPPLVQMGGSMLAGGAAGIPRASDAARRLAERGVQMTPGQLLGGGANTVEQALTSMPVVGGFIGNARGQGVTTFNQAVLQRALDAVGAKMPKGLNAEQQLNHTRETLGANYDRILGGMKGDLHAKPAAGTAVPGQIPPPPAPSLFDELSALKTMGKNLPAQQSKDLDRIVDNEILGKFTKGGRASGETLQDINRVLESEIADFSKSQDPYHQKLGQALKEAHAAMRRMIARENPDQAKRLDAIDAGYATFKQAQAGASRGKDGSYTANQFESALKAKDRSKDRRAYTEGTLPNQGLSKDAREVLSNTLPNSGTADRQALMSFLIGAGGGGAWLGGPNVGLAGAAAGLAVPSMYHPATLRALQAAMLNGTSRDTRLLNMLNTGAVQLQQPPQ